MCRSQPPPHIVRHADGMTSGHGQPSMTRAPHPHANPGGVAMAIHSDPPPKRGRGSPGLLPVPGWLPVRLTLGGWLGEVRLLREDEFAGPRDAQNVFLSFMNDDDLTGPLHQVSGPDALALGPRGMCCWVAGYGLTLSSHHRPLSHSYGLAQNPNTSCLWDGVIRTPWRQPTPSWYSTRLTSFPPSS